MGDAGVCTCAGAHVHHLDMRQLPVTNFGRARLGLLDSQAGHIKHA